MDLNEFLMYCRVSGYFDLNQIQTAIFRTQRHGDVPAGVHAAAGDTGGLVHAAPAGAAPDPVVQDGRVLPENLQKAGRDGVWLERKLREKGYHGPEEVLLAMAAGGDQLAVYPMETRRRKPEMP